jgi:hypothetical protein
MTPTRATNGKWTDNALVSQCVIGPWLVNNTAVAARYSAALTAAPTATGSKSDAGSRSRPGLGQSWPPAFDGTTFLVTAWALVWMGLLGVGSWL